MQAAASFKAQPRQEVGTGASRAARRSDAIPVVVYRNGDAPIHLTVEKKPLKMEYHNGGFFNKIIALEVGKETVYALPKEMQVHPVTDEVIHADFLRVDENSRIDVQVPVRFLNTEKCVGLKRGGVLNIVKHE